MVAKILSPSFELMRIIDVFNSFIWNEYFVGYGDFELRYPMDILALGYVQEGNYVSIDESDIYMLIEKVEIRTHVQEGNYVTISGRSLESLLLRRVIDEPVTLYGSFQESILRLLNQFAGDLERITFSRSTDPVLMSKTLYTEYDPGENVYDIIYSLCEAQRVGFKMVPQENGTFQFEMYTGVDHSYAQNVRPWVVFSSKYENLKYSNMTLDTLDYKNVAIVESRWTSQGTREVENPDFDPDSEESEDNPKTILENYEVPNRIRLEVGMTDTRGTERRELYVSSSSRPTEIKRSDMESEIDKSQFGEATDFVNKKDYMTWEVVYFDSAGYKAAREKFDKKFESRLSPRREVDVWTSKTGTWIANHGTSIQSASKARAGMADVVAPNWVTNYAPKKVQEPIDIWRHRNEQAFAWAERNEPSKEAYYKYGWVMSSANEAKYEADLAAAQEKIDSQYEAAVDDAYNNAVTKEYNLTRQAMESQGWAALAPYLVITSFDGEVDPNVQFIYGRDYLLGDIVQIVNEFGFQAKTRVVGIIFSEEEGEGFKVLPTFESDDQSEVDL